MYEIIIQSLLCCCDFLIGFMLFHHFLLEKWNVTVGNIAVKTASVLLSGTVLACINFFGIFWLNVIATVVLNFILASCFYKGKILVRFFLSVLIATLSTFFEFFIIILLSVFGIATLVPNLAIMCVVCGMLAIIGHLSFYMQVLYF